MELLWLLHRGQGDCYCCSRRTRRPGLTLIGLHRQASDSVACHTLRKDSFTGVTATFQGPRLVRRKPFLLSASRTRSNTSNAQEVSLFEQKKSRLSQGSARRGGAGDRKSTRLNSSH